MNASNAEKAGAAPERSMPEALARTLRHEVGDFLQRVYASVAILQNRLPLDAKQERELLVRLRARAEVCKHLMDAVQDFLCPVFLACEPVDLSRIAAELVTAAQKQHPHLEISADSSDAQMVSADPIRVAQIGAILLTNACESGGRCVTFRTVTDPGAQQVEWLVLDDGPGVSSEECAKLFRPFWSTRAGHAGLGLALARKLVHLHEAQIQAGNLPTGGFQVSVRWPAQAPAT